MFGSLFTHVFKIKGGGGGVQNIEQQHIGQRNYSDTQKHSFISFAVLLLFPHTVQH
jgi:hypothetical protein